jgi:hypothetical protein
MSEEKVEPAEGKSFYRYSERTRTRINDNKTPDYYADDSFVLQVTPKAQIQEVSNTH